MSTIVLCMQSYTKLNDYKPIIKDVVLYLINNNFDMMLVGGAAADYYGISNSSTVKDIDFLMLGTAKNVKILFNYLKKFFNIHNNFTNILDLHLIRLVCKNNQVLEFFNASKTDAASLSCLCKYKTYNELSQKSNNIIYLELPIKIIGLADMIDSDISIVECLKEKKYDYSKYQQRILNYRNKFVKNNL